MAVAGRVAIVPKGEWSADATYKRLDAVTYNNTLYFAKKEVPAGTATSNTEYWSKSIVGGAGGVATADEAGVVKPADGLAVAEDGTLKVNIDGTTLTMDQVNNVIKLADTLKEKINGAFPAANVVNNQITTETGYALDARQANPNLDGTLAKQLSDLNGSLLKFQRFTVTTTEITVNSDSYIQLLYPQSYKELIALIPLFIRPRSHWNSRGAFWNFDGSQINFHIIGLESASAQTFDIEYYWVYK
jgi:hypothetical protein|nr:MAG TPA: hypothetical protein [Caudoviricetes sp.]